MYGYVVYMCVSAPHACLVPLESWGWAYRQVVLRGHVGTGSGKWTLWESSQCA